MNKGDHHHGTPRAAVGRIDWRHIHHSPVFWVGVFLFLVAIAIYILSDDLSWRSFIRHP